MARAPLNVAANINPYINPDSAEVVNRFGKTYTPAQANGEGLEYTPYLAAAGMAKQDITLPDGTVWSEPGVPVSASTDTVLIQRDYGGSYVEIGGGDGAEFINIIHRTGSRITIASDGSVTITGAGDIVLSSDGNSVDVFDGGKVAKYSAGYSVAVSGGKTTINSAGPIELISGQDITLAAGGKINLNAQNAVDIAGARVAVSARVDTLDLYSTGKMSLESASRGLNILSAEALNLKSTKKMSLSSAEKAVIKAKGLGLDGSGEVVALVGSTIHLNSPGEEAGEVGEATPANKTALGAAPPLSIDVPKLKAYSYGNIQAGDLDDM